jgi:hypothetical protein
MVAAEPLVDAAPLSGPGPTQLPIVVNEKTSEAAVEKGVQNGSPFATTFQ